MGSLDLNAKKLDDYSIILYRTVVFSCVEGLYMWIFLYKKIYAYAK
jgi:hypothetical protein